MTGDANRSHWRRRTAGREGAEGRPGSQETWSRHDRAFAASAAVLVGLTLAARIGELAPFHIYPEVHAGAPGTALALGAALALIALLPFADRRGIEP